jgi:hypothetical protein
VPSSRQFDFSVEFMRRNSWCRRVIIFPELKKRCERRL